jgi:hypothetical protein
MSDMQKADNSISQCPTRWLCLGRLPPDNRDVTVQPEQLRDDINGNSILEDVILLANLSCSGVGP